MLARVRVAFAARPWAWGASLVAVAALASSVTGLRNGFAYDDIPIIVENPMVTELHTPAEYLLDSYWGPARGNSLYRPLTISLFSLQWAVGDGSPFPFHLLNVLLYAATAVAVLALLRLFLPPAAALLGGVAWAVHPVHVEATANVVGQSEMVAAIPMLAALVLYLRARAAGVMPMRTTLAILACYATALATKEHGIVLPALLALAELAHRWGRPGSAPASPVPWPLARSAVLLTVAYLIVRTSVLAGFAGDTPHPAWDGVSAWERRWAMLALLPEFARLLLWPARLYADYSPQAVVFETTPGLAHLPGVLLVAAYASLLAWAWRRDRVVTFALLWFPVTLAPISNVLIPTGVILAERTLFLPSLSVALLVGAAATRLAPRLAALPRPHAARLAIVATCAVLVAGAARSAGRQRAWEDNASLFATTAADAPANYRAHHALGELFGGAGSWKRAEEHLRIADSLFPGYDLIELSLARALHFDDRCPEAVPIYEAVLAERPDAEVAHIGRTACLLEMRRLSDARAAAVAGLSRGLSPGPFGLLLQKAESSLVANDTVDARNRWWRAGAPVSKSDARLKVPVLMVRPAGADRRRRMPDSTPKTP